LYASDPLCLSVAIVDKKIPCLWLALCLYGKSQQYDFTQSHPQKGDVLSADPLSTSGWTFVLNCFYLITKIYPCQYPIFYPIIVGGRLPVRTLLIRWASLLQSVQRVDFFAKVTSGSVRLHLQQGR